METFFEDKLPESKFFADFRVEDLFVINFLKEAFLKIFFWRSIVWNRF